MLWWHLLQQGRVWRALTTCPRSQSPFPLVIAQRKSWSCQQQVSRSGLQWDHMSLRRWTHLSTNTRSVFILSGVSRTRGLNKEEKEGCDRTRCARQFVFHALALSTPGDHSLARSGEVSSVGETVSEPWRSLTSSMMVAPDQVSSAENNSDLKSYQCLSYEQVIQ